MTTPNTTSEPPKDFGTLKPARTPTAKHRAAAERRRVALVRRANRLGARIGELAERKRTALEKLAQSGIGPIEVDGSKFIVVKPRAHYVFYREFDLKELPKNPRKPKDEAAAAAEVSEQKAEVNAEVLA